MKNYLFLVSFICLFSFTYGQGLNVDAIVGFNASQLDGDQMAGFNKLGLLMGGAAGVDLRDDFAVQLRVLFSQKGSRFTEKDPVDFNYRLNYLDFPLIFNYRLNESLFESAENFGLEAGLQYSILLGAREGDPRIGYVRLYDDFEPSIYGFILGLSYVYHEYTFRLNFQRSLVSTFKPLSFLDRTLSFSIAYSLGSTTD